MDEVENQFKLTEYPVCSVCSKILSISPVYADHERSICGRCDVKTLDKNPDSLSRQFSYEKIAVNFIFPCPYEVYGCKTQLKFNEAHDTLCKYRPLNCPFSNTGKVFGLECNCSWVGSGMALKQHIEECHSTFIHRVPVFEVTNDNVIFCTNVGPQLFVIVLMKGNSERYYVSVMIVGQPEELLNYRYQISLYTTNEDALTMRQRKVDSIFNFETLVSDPSSNMFEINLPSLKHSLIDDKFAGKISIIKRIKRENSHVEVEVVKKMKPAYDEDLLSELECPVCRNSMIPPIYICISGHSICNVCKPLVSKTCPTCRGELNDTRNFTLEKLTTRVKYPCRNRSMGCPFVTTSTKIKEHEITCEFSGFGCVLKCQLSGCMEDIIEHLKQFHKQKMFEVGKPYSSEFSPNLPFPYFAAIYDGQIFRFALKLFKFGNEQKMLKFSLQHLNSHTKPVYKYTVKFLDINKTGVGLDITCLCENICKLPKEAFTSPSCPVVVESALKPFLKDNSFQYKILITKIDT